MNVTKISKLPTPRTDALRMWGPLDDRITTLQDHARRLERENSALVTGILEIQAHCRIWGVETERTCSKLDNLLIALREYQEGK